MSIVCLKRGLSLICIGAIWLLSLVCLLMRLIASLLPEPHKNTLYVTFIANSSSCTTTELSIILTSCLTTFKNNVTKYCDTVYERNGIIYLCLLKIHVRILYRLKSKGFLASSVPPHDLSTLYTTLSHNLIKEKLTEFIEQTFNREFSLYLACNEKRAFFTSEQHKRCNLWLCQKVVMLSIIFWTIYL